MQVGGRRPTYEGRGGVGLVQEPVQGLSLLPSVHPLTCPPPFPLLPPIIYPLLPICSPLSLPLPLLVEFQDAARYLVDDLHINGEVALEAMNMHLNLMTGLGRKNTLLAQ